jgi:HNH endonuclease/AP2 domain
MIEIKLTMNQIAWIDDADFKLVNMYKWNFSRKSSNYGSAVASGGKRGFSISMHRLIMDAPKGLEVDHINGNPLDNRRNNLRLVTHSQNQKNMSKHKDNKSGYKGVSWHKKAKKWQVHVGKKGYIGLFTDPKEAAKAYNIAALEHFGEFAKLNEIKD